MSETEVKLVSNNKCFSGQQRVYQHNSAVLQCEMKFAVYLPSSYGSGKRLPVLLWLSGLTCSEQNFITKSGYHRYAENNQLIVVAPDTSPRGLDIEGIKDSWDFGEGAGFYVDATEPKWSANFRMYSYVNDELHRVLNANFETNPSLYSIFGHSMGGHGALVSFLKNSNKYKSCSAFAPICNPSNCPWGVKAFTNYLGDNRATWNEYDASHLVSTYNGPRAHILIDQGSEDNFLKQNQLLPENFKNSVESNKDNVELQLNFRDGYDHSYYFISTFIEDHINFHAAHLV